MTHSLSLRDYPLLLKKTVIFWTEDAIAVWSAALAYYTIFSLSPLLILAISIAGLIFGRADVEGQIFMQLQDLLGNNAAAFIQSMLKQVNQPSLNSLTAIISIIILLFGAAGVFGQLKQALNAIWKVKPAAKAGIGKMIKDRFLSFSMVLVIGFLLLVSLVASAAISAFTTFFNQFLPLPAFVLQSTTFLVSVGIITFLFALVFKVLPDMVIPWKPVWIAALFTSLLFTLGKTVMGIYIGRSIANSTYGAAASLVVILLWVYYAAQILFLGAEFCKVYVLELGLPLVAKPLAVQTEVLLPKRPLEERSRKKQELVGVATLGFFLGGFLGEYLSLTKRKK